jgi:hypothetical protein
LTPGDYEVAGQDQQQLIFTILRLASNVPGAFQPNSIQSLEGPVTQTGCMGISYQIPAGGTQPQNFRFKFTMSGSGTTPFC